MTTKKFTVCFTFFIVSLGVLAQMTPIDARTICVGSQILQSESVQEFDPIKDQSVWNTAIIQKSLEEEDPELEKIIARRKKEITAHPGPDIGIDLHASYKTDVVSTATMEANFDGCTYDGGSPSDNTIAVSKAGYIVASANSTVNFYDKNNTKIKVYTLPTFGKGITGTLSFDPKVLYDYVYDRFILVYLEGKTASTSKIVVCFSSSGNPTDKWYIYRLSGNVNNKGVWFDFPNIGISENDLFICGNKFTDGGATRGSVLFQIVKQPGYKGGGSLKYKTYDTLETQFQDALFSLYPASHGQSLSGPGMYFVNSIKGGGNEIDISQVTDSLNSGKAVFKVAQYSTLNYEVPLSALMKGSPNAKLLSNNDCRILGAFTLKNYIFFCFHADIHKNGYSSLVLGRFDTKTNKIDTTTLSGYQASFGFPNIASIGYGDWDNTIAMTFLVSSKKDYPSCYYTTIEQNFTWATPTLIKGGDWYYNSTGTQNDERWGDYTGICRWNGNYCPAVVCHGSYALKTIQGATTLGNYASHIARLVYCNPNGVDQPSQNISTASIYPNPVQSDFVHVDFEVNKNQIVKIDIYDAEGKLVQHISDSKLSSGKYSFLIETSRIPNGLYYIQISDGRGQSMVTQKMVVAK